MVDKKEVPQIPGMAFYHKDGLVPAWKQATRFAGEGGRIATLPDIINARLSTSPGSAPWERYFTATSAEYLGTSLGGNRILIIAHGVGPMSTLDGILKAYSWEFKDKDRNRRGGRISREEFLKLESGSFGPVEIVDFNKVMNWHKYSFYHFMTRKEAATLNPLVRARLGISYEAYLERHHNFAREFSLKQYNEMVEEPIIITMGDASNCPYGVMKVIDGQAIAHLLSISGLGNWQLPRNDYPNGSRGGSLGCEVNCHEWWDGVRLASIRAGVVVINIHAGVDDVGELLRHNWQTLMKPVSPPANVVFRILIKVGKNWFTEYLKRGASMDTGEPEFHVTSLEKIGKPVEFVTIMGGYHMFFRYDIKEVKAIAPRDANTYTLVGDPETVYHEGNPKYHRASIQFYRAEIDTSQRLTREDELINDHETLMSLVVK